MTSFSSIPIHIALTATRGGTHPVPVPASAASAPVALTVQPAASSVPMSAEQSAFYWWVSAFLVLAIIIVTGVLRMQEEDRKGK